VVSSIIWDWNGTLLDDVAHNLRVVNGILERRGLATLSLLEYRRVFSFPIQGFYKVLGLAHEGEEYDRIAREYVSGYTADLGSCSPTAGVQELLSRLSGRGGGNYILSATNHPDLLTQVEAVGLGGRFERILGNDDIRGKSKADKAALLLREEGLAPERTLLVGDTLHDLEVADHIGVRCILYRRGHQELRDCRPYAAVDDLSEVIDYL